MWNANKMKDSKNRYNKLNENNFGFLYSLNLEVSFMKVLASNGGYKH